MRMFLRKWLKLPANRRGVTSMEYALIAFLVGLAVVTSAITLGSAINGRLTTVSSTPALQP